MANNGLCTHMMVAYFLGNQPSFKSKGAQEIMETGRNVEEQ
jgi:hypothetical protein